jgi:hypothetical protein
MRKGVFIGEEVCGVGDKGSGDTVVNVETLFKTVLENFQTSNCFYQLPKYQDFWTTSIHIKGILLYK